jgi:hypothetical protein
MEAGQRSSVESQDFGKELQGHLLSELDILGSINFSHPAIAQQADNSIPCREYRAGDESALS